MRQTNQVTAWGSFSFLYGPLLALAAVGVLAAILRWSYTGRKSLVSRSPTRANADGYGLLVPVAAPANHIEGEMLRRKLEAAGIRASLTQTLQGPRVMVFPGDATKAHRTLNG